MTGRVFDIQRFSVHDGPGIRTTVFMKGCPLSCRWCHNPEGLSGTISLQYFKDKCIGCGKCKERTELSDSEECPTGALTVCGRDVTVNELIKEVLRDRVFYGENGGVTFSGGECMLYPEFVAELARKCKENGVSVAIDTAGCVPYSSFESVLPYVDDILYDVKCIDPELHKKGTGRDNSLILQNLDRLMGTKKRILIRTPVISNFNDNGELERIKQFCIDRKLPHEILTYHAYGESKRIALEHI